MEFQSRIFVKVSNPGARISDMGGVLFYGSFLLIAIMKILKMPNEYMLYCLGLTVLAGIMIFVGRKIAKGNMFSIGLSDTELVVSEDGVRVGDTFYTHDQLTDLDFWIEGYDGMVGPQFKGYRSFRNLGKLSGTDNKIHFRIDGKKHLYQYYLQDENSMNNLSQVFRKYYERGIPFRECNRGGPTFLFHQVRSKNELENMKRREGYV
jgi:hypothetical protein